MQVNLRERDFQISLGVDGTTIDVSIREILLKIGVIAESL
jgi:hypothetical protein